MRNIFEIILLMFVTVSSYGQLPRKLTETHQSQCDSNKIIFVDTLGNEINSNQTKLVYNGIDIIYLDQLNDVDFKNLIELYHGESYSNDSTRKYCVKCREEAIKIVDSIDVNDDGVKELFLLRQWYCFASPPNIGPCGEGGKQLALSKYEVWDVMSKMKIFEVKNSLFNQTAVSTSVVKSRRCNIDVSINKFGSIILSNLSGNILGNLPEGTYKYDNAINAYKKE